MTDFKTPEEVQAACERLKPVEVSEEAVRAMIADFKLAEECPQADTAEVTCSPRTMYSLLLYFDGILSALTQSQARIAELEGALDKADSALEAAIEIADEAREEWDAAPSGMKAGKLLIALSGNLPGYRFDIDAIHAVKATIRALLTPSDGESK